MDQKIPINLYPTMPEQPYRVEFYYVETPRYVRHIEPIAHWLKRQAEALIAWCESRKTRITYPNGVWGPDIR